MSSRCSICGDLDEEGGPAAREDFVCPLCRLDARLPGKHPEEGHPPPRLGGFELLESLGRGPFGRVYKARSPEGRDVAVKAFAPNHWFSHIELDAWRRLVSISHPGIASVYLAAEDAGIAYLVREWVPGRSLDIMVPPAWPNRDEAVRLIVALANALHQAHEQGVIHGNLKLSNIILDPDGKPHLVDFRLISCGKQDDRARYAARDAVGFTYWAPEQARGAACDRRSDVYSLGVLLRILLTGEIPFQTAPQERPRLPPTLEAISQRATEFDPDLRFGSAAKLSEALARYLSDEPSPLLADSESEEVAGDTTEVRVPPPPTRQPPGTLSPIDRLWESMGTPAGLSPPSLSPPAVLPLPPPTPPAPTVSPSRGREPAAEGSPLRAGRDSAWRAAKAGKSTPGLVGRLWNGLRNWFSSKPESSEVEVAQPREITRRHTDISFPARVRVAKVYPLRVQIVPAEEKLPTGEVRQLPKPHAHDASMQLMVPANEKDRLRVSVSVVAENFEIDGALRADIDVPRVGKSAAVTFLLRGQEVGPGRIMIDFAQDGQPVGSVDLSPEVVAANQGESTEQVSGEGHIEIGPTPAGSPDVVIKVFEHRCGGQPGRLHFVLSSTHPALQDLPVLDGDLGFQDLRSDVAMWVASSLQTLGAIAGSPGATADEVSKALADVGHKLFGQLLPERLREMCWILRQRGVRSVLVLSDEPHIPWELIKPYRADPLTGVLEKEDGCWGETFALTRWLRGRPPVRHFTLGRVFALATESGLVDPGSTTRDMVKGAPGQPGAGLSAAEEIGLLRSLQPAGSSFVQLPAQRRKLHEAFERGGFDVLHLACHGTFGGSTSADGSAVLLEDGLFPATELSPRMAGALRRETPLIFFNACHSGRLGFAPTGLGSWGARLVQLGCGGFIGSLWPVTDKAAVAFARAFYGGLLRGGTIGEAMMAARLLVRDEYPGDPTWLAYCCFADPLARLQGKEG